MPRFEPLFGGWSKKTQRGARQGSNEKIVLRVRDNSVGRADYSSIDFLEDIKCACARESIPFDNDIFNELAQKIV